MKKEQNNFIMLPTNDFCFKELMQNPEVRKGFIAAILKKRPEEIKETTILPTETRGLYEDDKLGILDVNILLYDGSRMDMEMQVQYFAYWDKRILFYLGKMYTGQLRKGDGYEKLQKCIHVSVLDFVHFQEDEECYHIINLRDKKTGKLYTDLLEIHFLELPKLPKDLPEQQEGKGDSNEAVLQWMKFFSGKNKEDFEAMLGQDKYIDEAYRTLVELSADDKKRLEYEAREKAIRDYNTQINSAEERGEKRGKQEGISLAKKVYRLNAEGKGLEEIASVCGITIEDVKEILE